jgi:hypothetical protein
MPYENGTSPIGQSWLLNYTASFVLTAPEIYCARALNGDSQKRFSTRHV